MVLKFRLISNEQDDFIRDFEVLGEQTFFQFHMAIQDNLHFDKSQIASFFVCNEKWEKEQEITLFELSEEENANVIVMDNAVVKDYISEIHDKMLYVFDVFNERLFFMELVDKSDTDPSKQYPNCSFEQGHTPQQILMDSIFSSTKAFGNGPGLDDTFSAEELLDAGDLDELGYDQQYFDESSPDEE